MLTRTADLLEREYEFGQLAARVDAAVAGEGSVVALEGEAGIGKSALLAFAAQHAASAGMRVMSARAGELEQDFAYGVVRQLFDGPLVAMARPQRELALSGVAGLAGSALSISGGNGAAAAADPGSVLHGLYWLSANLAAGQPLLIADRRCALGGQRVDRVSRLSRPPRGRPRAARRVRVARRGGIQRAAACQCRARTRRGDPASGRARRASDRRADRADAGQRELREFAHACRVATAGNPFLLQELLRALQQDGITPESASCERVAQVAPGAISRATLARLRRLGRPATRLAFATAVLGKSAELRHAAALAELDLEAAGIAADMLTSAAILGEGRPLEFIHPIVRTTVYAEIPAAQRAASHMRAALLLEADGAGAAELAPHLMATEPAGDPGVVRRLRAAAADVRDRGAPDAACEYLGRALAEPPCRRAAGRRVLRAGVRRAVGRPRRGDRPSARRARRRSESAVCR